MLRIPSPSPIATIACPGLAVPLSDAQLLTKIEAHLEGLGPDLEQDESDRWDVFVQGKIDKHR